MHAYWMTFEKRGPGCVEAENVDDARAIATDLGYTPVSCNIIPYPADPRINKYSDERLGICPSFCYRPNKCKGKTACPNMPSCTS